jgi:hypothetical protein
MAQDPLGELGVRVPDPAAMREASPAFGRVTSVLSGSADPPLPVCSGHVRSLPAGLDSGSPFSNQENSSVGTGSAVSVRLVNAASNGPRLPGTAE